MARLVPLAGGRDLIVAPATPPGVGAVAIVRLSGPGARDVASRLYSPSLDELPSGMLRLGRIVDPANRQEVDRCLVVHWQAPRSYTGEDMVEFHLHGSPVIVDRVVECCLAEGARLAEPGEFTRRAFMAGKLDLTQAEAVATLTNARTDEARRAALAQLSGGLTRHLDIIRNDLVQVTAELEASVDYPEEHLPDADVSRLAGMVEGSRAALAVLAESYERGKLLSQGARIVLAGLPNAGKSSLFNALLRRERAIVSPHPGTTRDTLEATIDLVGIPVTLIDTAGLRSNAGEIESIGIERSRSELPAASLVLFLVNPLHEIEDSLEEYSRLPAVPHVVVFTHRDRYPESFSVETFASHFAASKRVDWIAIYTRSREGLEQLEQVLTSHFRLGPAEGGDVNVLTSQRHRQALAGAVAALEQVGRAIRDGLSPELIVLDLATALSQIDSVTGIQSLDEDVLDAIFSTFCLGK
ncbi:tRNA uridine-5-carboxymethylaminomethyl(34) synthesis GTPase MnmE [bacterium]|nr:tRNA uridine-5-carboxymethylaminomethyl(34) synthesis GTPase MnmE [bacterium]